MQYVKKDAVYDNVTKSQSWEETGKNTTKTEWAATNKGTSRCPNVRSRWVAKVYNSGPRPDLSSAASPLRGGEARHRSVSVQQHQGDSALGDRCTSVQQHQGDSALGDRCTSVQRQQGDSALGDRCTESILERNGGAQSRWNWLARRESKHVLVLRRGTRTERFGPW